MKHNIGNGKKSERRSAATWLNNLLVRTAWQEVFVCIVIFAGGQSGLAKEKWEPIPEADLAAKESTSSPGADVEILFSRQVLASYVGMQSTVDHYLRAKIYTPKGAEDWGRYRADIPPDVRLINLAGRVLKVDGSIVELQKADVHESVLLKYDNAKWKQTAFAFPNLAAGDIIECQWTEEHKFRIFGYEGFFQQTFPVREFQFKVENYPSKYWFEWRNYAGAKVESEYGSRMSMFARNIPPFEKEEFMPPEWDFRAGLMLIKNYLNYSNTDLWQAYSSYWDEEFQDSTKSSKLKNKAAQLVAGAKSDEEKLQRLYEFCQQEIGNLTSSDTAEAKAAREKREKKEEDTSQWAADTLEKRLGWPYEINNLFAGLAKAAGFEVKRAQSASRAEVLNVKTEKGWALLSRARIAVRVAGSWRFFSPGSFWVPYGMLDWTDEGVTALMCDDSKVIFENTAISPAEKSQVARKGRFTLDADGTLDGEVEQTYTGHEGIALKSQYADKAVDEVDRNFREQLVKRLPTAEVTDLLWTNLRTHDFPVSVRYKIRVLGYAEQAGKRLVVAPGYFEIGRPAIFTAEARKLPIFFPFTREEHDDIEITVPEGFELDHSSAPANVAAQENTIGARYQIGYKPKQRKLLYKRDFVLGGNQAIFFQRESYPALKKRFEKLHQSDTHALLLKPKAESSAPPSSATPTSETTSSSASP